MSDTYRQGALIGLICGVLIGVGIYFDRAEAGVGPGYSDSFTVECGVTPTLIRAPSGGQYSYACQNNTATDVHVGDSAVDLTAPKYCDGCASREFGGNLKQEYCVSAVVTTIACRAMVGSN